MPKPKTSPLRSRLTTVVAACAALAGSGMPGQGVLTSIPDGPGSVASPFEQSSRTQQFVSAAALGLPSGGTVQLSGMWLRHDGPSQTTTGAPHVLNRLVIRVGTTNRSVLEVGSVFGSNLSQPLPTVFASTNFTVPIDSIRSGSPQPWGGATGELFFPFSAQISVTVPQTGSLVIELEVEADATHSPGDTRIDFDSRPHAWTVGGGALSNGQSCGYPSLNPTVESDGEYTIGTAFTVSGHGFTANMPVATWWTALLGTQQTIPGTSNCWSYLDLGTGGILSIAVVDGLGNFGGDPPVPIPPTPGLCGARLYLQSAGLTQQTLMNPIGVETSNYRTIKIGCRKPTVRGWYVSHSGSWSASIATTSRGGSLSMRLR